MADDNNNVSSELESALAEINALEKEIALADYELLKEQVKKFQKIYVKRDEVVARIPNFWLRVFESFFELSFENPNIEDFELLSHLTAFKVARNPKEPKNVEFSFTFEPNEYLEDDSLTFTKTFYNIQSPEPDDEITSVKTLLKWKQGKDLTKPVKGAPPSFFTWFAFERLGQENNIVPDSDNLAVSLADEIYPHAHTIFQDTFVEDEDEFDEDEDLESDGEEGISDDAKEVSDEPAKKRHKAA